MHINILEWAAQEVWLSSPAQLNAIQQLAENIAGNTISPRMYERRQQRGSLNTGTRSVEITANGTAIVPITGVIAPKSSMIGMCEDGTSAMSVRRVAEVLAADPSVKRVLLMVDSGGGAASGVPEAAEALMKLRTKKPVISAITGIGASAAYWLASTAHRVFLEPSAIAGSIGVYTIVSSLAEKLKKDGIDARVVRAGSKKFTPNPIEPLSEEGMAMVQEKVSRFYDMFVSAVATQRNIDMSKALDMADGTVAEGTEAVDRGMVDSIATIDDVLAKADAGEFDTLVSSTAVLKAVANESEAAIFVDSPDVVAEEKAPEGDLFAAMSAELEKVKSELEAMKATAEADARDAQAARIEGTLQMAVETGRIPAMSADAFRKVAANMSAEDFSVLVTNLPASTVSANELTAPQTPADPLAPKTEYEKTLYAQFPELRKKYNL